MSLIVTHHPTLAFFHDPFSLGAFLIDLDRFSRMTKGKLEPGPKRININPKSSDVRRFHKWALRTHSEIAVDIETAPEHPDRPWTGKDPTRAKLKIVGIGNTEEALSHRWTDGSKKIERALKTLLEDTQVTKILQNGDWFDLRVFVRYGVTPVNCHDTRDARRALCSTSALRLAYLGSIYTDYFPWKEDESDEAKGLVFTKDLKKLKTYNGHDCVVTARVRRGIVAEPEWKSKRVQRLYVLHRDMSQIAAEMHSTGIRIDRPLRRWMKWALLKEYKEKERAVRKAVGIEGFDAQPNHMRALIYQKHAVGKYAHLARFNLPDPIDPTMYVNRKEMTTIGVSEDQLTMLLIDPDVPEDLKAIIQLYWDAAEVWKKRSTFVASAKVWHAIGKDGRLRPGWNSCGTDTGRWSCNDPNVMNIEILLRAMYIASKGCLLVGGDYSQLELRVMAAVSGDRALKAALATGDVYTEDAKAFFNLPASTTRATIKYEARHQSKIIHLLRQYGGSKKMTFQVGLKQDRSLKWENVSLLCDAFDRRYHETIEWWGREMERVLATGYSATRILDRRRVYPTPPATTDISNQPIQGTAADVKDLAMIRLWNGLKKHKMKSKIIIDLHDAFYLDSPKREVKAATDLMRECMEVEYVIEGKKVTFPTKIEAHGRWSEFK